MLNNLFVCDGFITDFIFFRGSPVGRAFIGIWRHLAENILLLKHRVEIDEAPIGIHRVQLVRPLVVDKGDILGVHYQRDAPRGVITSSVPDDGVLPAEEFYHTLSIDLHDEDLEVNTELDISQALWQLERRTLALAASVVYDLVSPTFYPTEGRPGLTHSLLSSY
jgi:hypothetical protein